MENARPYWKVIVSLLFSLLATAFVIVAGVGLIRFLVPFVIGWIISCIANPVVCWLDKKVKIEKKFGSAIMIVVVIAAVVGVLYLLGSMIVRELGGLVSNLPEMYEEIELQLKEIANNLAGFFEKLPLGMQEGWNAIVSGVGSAAGGWIEKISNPTVTLVGDIAKSIPSLIIATFVAILSAYFFVADRENVLAWFKKVIPEAVYKRLSMVVSNFKFSVGGYFKAQFKIMGVVGAILLVGLSILRIKYVIVLSLIIAFLDFLPFLGTGTAFVPWCVYTFLVGDYKRLIILVILYATTQIVRQLIQPKLVGDEVGLKPLPTLVFIYIGYKLGGVIWMILAVPLGMIIINMVKAGAFDYIINDVKILAKGIKSLRENKCD